MSKLYWFLCLIFYSLSGYAIEIQPYIVNGSNANLANYPSFASLFYRNNSVYSTSSFCGATMINNKYVLTAAHCIYGDNDLMLNTVVAPQLEDESNFLSSEQARATAFYYPDTYVDSSSELWRDDIAIIELETTLSNPDYSSLLNTTRNNNFSGADTFEAVGHGYIEGNVPGGTRLLDTELDYMSTASCQAIYGSKLTSKHLCFSGALQGGYRNSTCSGDSGGPVFWYNGSTYIQVGITSFGPSVCGDPGITVTSVFTDVYDYQAWINRVINGQEDPKAYVVTSGSTRSLVNTDSGSTLQASSSEGGGGGGSINLSIALALLLILLVRHWLHEWTRRVSYCLSHN